VPEQLPPAGFDPSATWSDPTATPYSPPSTPSDPWAPAIPQQPAYGQQHAYGQPPAYGQEPPHREQHAYGQQPTYGERPAYGQQPPYGQPAAAPHRQPPYQQPGYNPAQYGQPTYGRAPYGQPGPYGQRGDPGRDAQPPGYPQAAWGAPGQAAPANGWPPTQPRRRRTGLIVGIVAAVVVVVAGGLAAIGAAQGGSDNSTATKTTSKAPATPGIELGDGTALLGAIVTPSSAGHAQTIDGTSHGVMTLDQLISLSFDNDKAEKQRLTDRGFEASAQREWINSNNVQVDIQLIQFKDASGATEHVSNQVDAYNRDNDVTGSFNISGVSGGKGFEKSDRDSYGNRSATLIARAGNVAVLMFVFTPHNFDRATEMSVMAKQIAALRV
jgi:hypothetical protein